LTIGSVIKCNQEKIKQSKNYDSTRFQHIPIDLSEEGSFIAQPGNAGESIPTLSSLYSKIKDIGKEESSGAYFLNNVTVLEEPVTSYDEDGNPTETSALLGDETGEIEIFEIYEGEYLPGLKANDKIRIIGAYLYGGVTKEKTVIYMDPFGYGSIKKI
jgi:hypothetical protein